MEIKEMIRKAYQKYGIRLSEKNIAYIMSSSKRREEIVKLYEKECREVIV